MIGKTILITCFSLIVGGCASDGNKMESSGGSSSTASVPPAASSPAKSDVVAAESSSTSPSTSSAAASDSRSQANSSKNRIAAGVEEETLDTCVAGIPQDATAGQRMLAEQTCRRNYASRP